MNVTNSDTQKIIDEIGKRPLSDILTETIKFAHEKGEKELEKWARLEKMGYSSYSSIPKYRTVVNCNDYNDKLKIGSPVFSLERNAKYYLVGVYSRGKEKFRCFGSDSTKILNIIEMKLIDHLIAIKEKEMREIEKEKKKEVEKSKQGDRKTPNKKTKAGQVALVKEKIIQAAKKLQKDDRNNKLRTSDLAKHWKIQNIYYGWLKKTGHTITHRIIKDWVRRYANNTTSGVKKK